MSEPHDSFLSHYGVKGMKWGVRRETSVNLDGGAAGGGAGGDSEEREGNPEGYKIVNGALAEALEAQERYEALKAAGQKKAEQQFRKNLSELPDKLIRSGAQALSNMLKSTATKIASIGGENTPKPLAKISLNMFRGASALKNFANRK